MAKARFYLTSIPDIGITAIYNKVGDLWLEKLFVPKTNIQFVDRLPLMVREILESEFDVLAAQWNVFLMLGSVPEPEPKKIFEVEEKFIPKTKYLVKVGKLELIGFSELTMIDLETFFEELFKEKTGLVMRDSNGLECNLIPWDLLEKAKYTFNDI